MNDYRKRKDEECVKRGDVHEMLVGLSKNATMTEVIIRVHNIPPIPHEMTAREYGKTLRKICASYNGKCFSCELGIPCAIPDERTIPIVEKWAREHPEERSDE